jgi:hypothetical protein
VIKSHITLNLLIYGLFISGLDNYKIMELKNITEFPYNDEMFKKHQDSMSKRRTASVSEIFQSNTRERSSTGRNINRFLVSDRIPRIAEFVSSKIIDKQYILTIPKYKVSTDTNRDYYFNWFEVYNIAIGVHNIATSPAAAQLDIFKNIAKFLTLGLKFADKILPNGQKVGCIPTKKIRTKSTVFYTTSDKKPVETLERGNEYSKLRGACNFFSDNEKPKGEPLGMLEVLEKSSLLEMKDKYVYPIKPDKLTTLRDLTAAEKTALKLFFDDNWNLVPYQKEVGWILPPKHKNAFVDLGARFQRYFGRVLLKDEKEFTETYNIPLSKDEDYYKRFIYYLDEFYWKLSTENKKYKFFDDIYIDVDIIDE